MNLQEGTNPPNSEPGRKGNIAMELKRLDFGLDCVSQTRRISYSSSANACIFLFDMGYNCF